MLTSNKQYASVEMESSDLQPACTKQQADPPKLDPKGSRYQWKSNAAQQIPTDETRMHCTHSLLTLPAARGWEKGIVWYLGTPLCHVNELQVLCYDPSAAVMAIGK